VLVQDRLILGAGAGALVLAGVAIWLLLVPPGTVGPEGSASPRVAFVDGTSAPVASQAPAEIVVDVEGAVAEPGVHRLPAGSRVADAIAAAGGYAPGADLAASARALNLAASLADGDQIYVPRQGETSTGGGTGASADAGGLLNLNQATADQLDALPGIGPVTVQKIVDARAQQPFATLDELVTRKVLTASQLAQIRDRVTV
jgi:competence protein ComEA